MILTVRGHFRGPFNWFKVKMQASVDRTVPKDPDAQPLTPTATPHIVPRRHEQNLSASNPCAKSLIQLRTTAISPSLRIKFFPRWPLARCPKPSEPSIPKPLVKD